MSTQYRYRRSVAFALAAAALIAACGSGDDAVSAGDAVDQDAIADESMDGMAMNMGDAAATPADEAAGASLARGEYQLLESRPEGYDALTGTAVIARHAAGTTVTTELSGLLPDAEYISHLHAQPCAIENGGPHYQFEVGGDEVPPNEIHLAFTSDADGNGFMTAENDQVAGTEAVAFVVHPVELIDNKIACVDFVDDAVG